MTYTKNQLIQAFCAAQNCTVEDLPAIQERIQAELDEQRAFIQTQLNAIPATAKDQMKAVALNYLTEQIKVDNAGVIL